MKSHLWSLALASAALICGCGTPSIHPLASDDTKASDPALVGKWAKVEAGKNDAVYTVSPAGDHYALTVEDPDAKPPERWEFEFRLVQLGKHRFVDVQATEADRQKVDDKWSSCFIPAHLFGRYVIDGNTLKFWALKPDWLQNGLSQGKIKLAHTGIDHGWTLITAPTAELQAFLKDHAEDPGAFDLTELKRSKP